MKTCETCKGLGTFMIARDPINPYGNSAAEEVVCPRCGGKGTDISRPTTVKNNKDRINLIRKWASNFASDGLAADQARILMDQEERIQRIEAHLGFIEFDTALEGELVKESPPALIPATAPVGVMYPNTHFLYLIASKPIRNYQTGEIVQIGIQETRIVKDLIDVLEQGWLVMDENFAVSKKEYPELHALLRDSWNLSETEESVHFPHAVCNSTEAMEHLQQFVPDWRTLRPILVQLEDTICPIADCATCQHTGFIEEEHGPGIIETVQCPDCHGTGKVIG